MHLQASIKKEKLTSWLRRAEQPGIFRLPISCLMKRSGKELFGNLLKIQDNYEKIVVSADEFTTDYREPFHLAESSSLSSCSLILFSIRSFNSSFLFK